VHRLFVAIDLPGEIKYTLSSLRCPVPGVKWVAEEQLHLTLRFIGDADDDFTKRIVTGLFGISAAQFPLVLKGVGCFPPRRDPKVLWVGVDKSDSLLGVQSEIEKVLVQTGVVPEGRPFSPHITIARLREVSATRIASFLQKNNTFSTPGFPVSEFTLYSSTLARDGAVHRKIALFPLHG